jgi:hypothetical protein
MAKPGITNLQTSQTFQNWFDKTNDVIDILKTEIVTATPAGDTTTGDAILIGDFTATNFEATGTISSDTFAAANTAANITFAQPGEFSSGQKVTAIFAYGASGGQARFTNNVFNWDIGLDNNTDANFVIKTSTTTPFKLSPNGKLTLTDLEVTGNTTLGASGSVVDIAHGAFKAGDNIVFTGPDANNQIEISAGQSYDGTGLDIVVPRQVSHQGDADTRIRFDHMSESGARNGQTIFENNGHVMMYIHGEERSTDRRVDFILKDDLSGTPTVAGASFYQATNGLGTDSGKTSFNVEGTITSGLNTTVNEDGTIGNKLRVRNGANIELENTSDNVKITLEGNTGNIDIDGTFNASSVTATGNIQAGGDLITLSDKRVKENIKDLSDSLDKVNQMRGVSYNKIGDIEEKIGFIAQELEAILPQVIAEDSDKYKNVAYGNIVPVLVEAIKELSTKIEKLEKNSCKCACDK